MRFLKFALSAALIVTLAACAYPDAGQRDASYGYYGYGYPYYSGSRHYGGYGHYGRHGRHRGRYGYH